MSIIKIEVTAIHIPVNEQNEERNITEVKLDKLSGSTPVKEVIGKIDNDNYDHKYFYILNNQEFEVTTDDQKTHLKTNLNATTKNNLTKLERY